MSVRVHRPFDPPWDRTLYALVAESRRVVVELAAPLAGRGLVNAEGEPIAVDRLPAGCGMPEPEYDGAHPLAIGTKDLKESSSVVKVAFGDRLGRRITRVKAVECADRVYVSATAGTERGTRKVQIVAVRLAAPIGTRRVMSVNGYPLSSR